MKKTMVLMLILCAVLLTACSVQEGQTNPPGSEANESRQGAQTPEEASVGSKTPSEARRQEQAIFLRDALASHQADLERIANDLIGLAAQSQQPFSVEYDIASEKLSITSADLHTENREADSSVILSAVRRIHSNPQLEGGFEQIWMIAELRGFSSYVVQFVLPVYTDESECHYRLSLCFSLDEAPTFMSYYWVEAIDSHWFLMEEIME